MSKRRHFKSCQCHSCLIPTANSSFLIKQRLHSWLALLFFLFCLYHSVSPYSSSILPKGLALPKRGNSFQVFHSVSHCSRITLVVALLKTAIAAPGDANKKHWVDEVVLQTLRLKGNHSHKQPGTSPGFRAARCLGSNSWKCGDHPKKRSTVPTQSWHTIHLPPAVHTPSKPFHPRWAVNSHANPDKNIFEKTSFTLSNRRVTKTVKICALWKDEETYTAY
jgi:hypothetical protein